MDVNDAQRVYSLGYELEECKVTFLKKVSITLPQLVVEGKQGDVLGIPRWIANVLEKSQNVQIQETDIKTELKQAVLKENIQNEFDLSTLEPNFYVKINAYMKKASTKDKEEVKSMLNSLVRKRNGKIIHLADSSKLTATIANKLTVEEKIFYNNLYEISQNFIKFAMGDNL